MKNTQNTKTKNQNRKQKTKKNSNSRRMETIKLQFCFLKISMIVNKAQKNVITLIMRATII